MGIINLLTIFGHLLFKIWAQWIIANHPSQIFSWGVFAKTKEFRLEFLVLSLSTITELLNSKVEFKIICQQFSDAHSFWNKTHDGQDCCELIQGCFPPVTTKMNIFVLVQNLRNSIWNSNLTYHQFNQGHSSQLYYECVQFISLLLLFPLAHNNKGIPNGINFLVMV